MDAGPRGRGAKGALAMLLALAVGGGLGFGLYVLEGRGLLPVKIPATSPAPGGPASSAAAASPSTDTRTPDAEPPASAEVEPTAAPDGPERADACLRGLFPEDTFAEEPRMAFVCEENDALAAVTKLKTLIVVQGRGRAATGGMKEWAVMGMYELATLATLRGRCCPDAAPLTVPDSPPTCGPMGESLAALGRASRPGATKVDRDAAVKRFDEDVRCLMKLRQTQRFGFEPLLGGEASTFEKTASRLGAPAE